MVLLRIGEVGGKNRIYDACGNLITISDERILLKRDDVLFAIWKSGRFGPLDREMVFPRGEGKLYKTTKRLVFIGEPVERIALLPCPGASPPVGPVFITIRKKDKEVREGNVKRYCEIRLDEISRCRKGFFKSYRMSVGDIRKNQYIVYLKMK